MVLTDGYSSNEGVPDETATFCKVDGGTPDPKVPTIIGQPDFSVVQVCPETADQVTMGFVHRFGVDAEAPVTKVMNANPPGFGGFHVRVVFDELLDPAVETLTDSMTGGPCTPDSDTCDGNIDSTMPVDVMCNGTAVPYNGYYVPNGNLVSWPPGPSLVVVPDASVIATSADCQVTLRDTIVDKQGEVVPAAQRGPFTWAVAGLTVAGTDPADGDELADDAPLLISFTADIDDTTLTTADITVEDSTGPVGFALAVNGTDVEITPTAPTWTDDETYTVTILDTADFADVNGGPYVGGEFITTFTAVAP